jgi:hypothetical protein
MKRLFIATLLMMGLLSSYAVYAHHSAAGIDRAKTVTIEGTVKQFKWANPHAWLDMEVANNKGGVDIWSLEMTSPAILVGAGWKATTLKAGDSVKAVVNPFKNGDPGGIFVSVTLADGKTLSQRGQGQNPAATAPGAPAAPPAPPR